MKSNPVAILIPPVETLKLEQFVNLVAKFCINSVVATFSLSLVVHVVVIISNPHSDCCFSAHCVYPDFSPGNRKMINCLDKYCNHFGSQSPILLLLCRGKFAFGSF